MKLTDTEKEYFNWLNDPRLWPETNVYEIACRLAIHFTITKDEAVDVMKKFLDEKGIIE